MSRSFRYLIPCLILLAVAALFAWLIFAKVFVSYVQFEYPGPRAERFEQGWPWVFVESYELAASASSPPRGSHFSFATSALVVDLAIALAALLVVVIWLRLRLRRARPWQLSVRSVLVLVAIIACVSGWFAREYRLWQREQQAIEALARWELSKVYRGPQWLLRFRSREKLEIFHRAVTAMTPVLRRTDEGLLGLSDGDLRSFTDALPALPHLRSVEVVDTMPAGFDEFDRWTTIERLDLTHTFATDDVLRRVSRMPRLKSINLEMREEFTEKGLAHLARVNSLEEINLDSTSVTDRGIAALATLPRLRVLSATQTAISNAAVESFCHMWSLEELKLYATRISDSGARRLGDLPKLKELWLPYKTVSEETAEFLRQEINLVQRD